MKFHKKKSLILKALSLLPSNFGFYVYHKIQKRSFKNLNRFIDANKSSYNTLNQILDTVKLDLKNKNIIEIGSGWLPLMPYILKAETHCNKIYTYDLNAHYNTNYIVRLDQYFKTERDITFKKKEFDAYKLPEFLNYYPKTNIINSLLPKDAALVYSRFVLEHVKPKDILEMHKKFYTNLPNNTYILHLISPSDHRAYSDKSLSYYDFLKYSEKEWNNIQTKFDYHNRLRLPQYLNIFNASGYEVVYLHHDKVDKKSDKYKMFKALKLHTDYANFKEEDILAGSINVLLKKKN